MVYLKVHLHSTLTLSEKLVVVTALTEICHKLVVTALTEVCDKLVVTALTEVCDKQVVTALTEVCLAFIYSLTCCILASHDFHIT